MTTICASQDAFTGRGVNPPASTFPAACHWVSEQKRNGLFRLRIEDSPQLAAEIFKFLLIIFQRAVRIAKTGFDAGRTGSPMHHFRTERQTF
jgi:hypothetical protein